MSVRLHLPSGHVTKVSSGFRYVLIEDHPRAKPRPVRRSCDLGRLRVAAESLRFPVIADLGTHTGLPTYWRREGDRWVTGR